MAGSNLRTTWQLVDDRCSGTADVVVDRLPPLFAATHVKEVGDAAMLWGFEISGLMGQKCACKATIPLRQPGKYHYYNIILMAARPSQQPVHPCSCSQQSAVAKRPRRLPFFRHPPGLQAVAAESAKNSGWRAFSAYSAEVKGLRAAAPHRAKNPAC